MYKKLISILIITIMAIILFSGCNYSTETLLETQPNTFANETELKNLINSFNEQSYSNYRDSKNATDDLSLEAVPEAATSGDYSQTNTQVEGVDEGDIIKTDGQYIYKLQSTGVLIVKANGGNIEKMSEIKIDNYVPKEIYVSGDSLILIGGIYSTINIDSYCCVEPMRDIYFSYNDTDIRIYDITDIQNPVLQRHIKLNGYYHSSRLIDNNFYFITNYYFYYGNEKTYIPKISDSEIEEGAEKNIDLKNIYYYESVPSYCYMIMGKIDISSPTESILKAYLGLGGTIYVSQDNIYIATADYSSCYNKTILGSYQMVQNCFAKTRIVKIGLNNLEQKAITRVDGTIKDRYSMDEYQGYLRVATTVNIWNMYFYEDGNSVTIESNETSSNNNSSNDIKPDEIIEKIRLYNNVYVLNENLKLTGKCEKIAPNETIYSVSFNKEKGSLVTFKFTDPYFILNLSDPANPTVSQGLKEDGVSHYLHDISDDLTIGIGRDSETITTSWGERVVWKGLKVSLYDTSGEDAVNICTPQIQDFTNCDYVFAEIFYNPKALLYNKDRGLFAFSVQMWNYTHDEYYYCPSNMKQGVAIFNFDIENQTIIYRGFLSNFDNNVSVDEWENYYKNYWSFVKRSVQIGDYIYTISEKYITSYDFNTLEKVQQFTASENPDIYRYYY